jgi:hypothetical protein
METFFQYRSYIYGARDAQTATVGGSQLGGSSFTIRLISPNRDCADRERRTAMVGTNPGKWYF